MLTVLVAMTSCGGQKSLIVPHSVSSAEAIPIQALNLQKGGYEILQTLSETASVTAQYGSNKLKIQDGNGEFSYTFRFDTKTGWTLDKFRGTANFG